MSSLAPLSALSALTDLWLQSNALAAPSELRVLGCLPGLQRLAIASNPMAKVSRRSNQVDQGVGFRQSEWCNGCASLHGGSWTVRTPRCLHLDPLPSLPCPAVALAYWVLVQFLLPGRTVGAVRAMWPHLLKCGTKCL